MRSTRFGLVLCLSFLLNNSVWAQQTTTPPPAPKDPQAVSIANQALTIAGGRAAISEIEDYRATGTVTYHIGNEASGPVTIRESGLTQLRMDAQLPGGARSQAMNEGQIRFSEGGVTSTALDPAPFYPGRVVLPNLFLAAATISPVFSLSYKGTVEVDGRSAHEIEVQCVMPHPEMIRFKEGLTMHLFVDAMTLRVVMMQEVSPRQEVRQVRYSDYRLISGVLVPFAVSEQIEGHRTWTLQLSQINFNSGLQDSDFEL
jgi:hypothetical protein